MACNRTLVKNGGETGNPIARFSFYRLLIILLACAQGTAGAVSGADTTDPLVFPDSNVVLLSGLPGDLESENTYNNQLRSWLQILSRGFSPTFKLHVLTDNPAVFDDLSGLATPGSSKPKLLKSDRTNFLTLAKAVSVSDKPLVVIAWGHGGRQGAAPVFHVRGERLTPDDFRAMAPENPDVPSRWILIFRSSGAFASRIAAPGRQTISSEADTMFTSDPIGMNVLLDLLQADPALPFAALGHQLGRSVAGWYEERRLARTEEPALWLGTDKPVFLAGATNILVESAVAERQMPGDNPAPASGANAPASASQNLPENWKSIHTVTAEEYPGTDGVILRRHLSYTLGSNPAVSTEHDEYTQILTPEGKHLADFDVSYAPPFEELSFLDCEILQPGGKLVRLDPDAIREAREKSVGDYHMGSRKFFSLPGVGPGAILHVRYRVVQKTFPLPHFSMSLPVTSELPALQSALTVSLPKAAAFHFALENSPNIDPSINQGNYGTTYTWAFTNLPAHLPEVLSPPGQLPRLLISTFADWQAFAGWYSRITQLADDLTPEIRAKALELVRDAKTDRDKVVAIYNYVTALRYVAIPLGINSLRPHAAANVLANQYGDCKDKANLFKALLRSLNIQAHLVLVPRFAQAYDSIPGLAFNHAISRVILGAETLWIDTTDDVCRFGMLPPGDPGRKVLVIDGQSTTLSELPWPISKDHQLRLRAVLNCHAPEEPIETSLKVAAFGYPDYQLRLAARESRERNGQFLPLLSAAYRPAVGSFSLETQSATSSSALDQDFLWDANGASHGVFSLSKSTREYQLHAPFWIPVEWDLALHNRKSPLFLNQGFPLSLDQELEFVLSPNTRILACPPTLENRQPPLRWKIEWDHANSGRIVARFSAELERGELPASLTTLVQRQLAKLLSSLACATSLNIPE